MYQKRNANEALKFKFLNSIKSKTTSDIFGIESWTINQIVIIKELVAIRFFFFLLLVLIILWHAKTV